MIDQLATPRRLASFLHHPNKPLFMCEENIKGVVQDLFWSPTGSRGHLCQ